MRILQVSSDWKWTGPAEPMCLLVEGLRARGHHVELVCPEAPSPGTSGLASRARARGIEPLRALARGRGWHPLRDRADARALRRLVRGGGFDVVHAWHTRCHVLALRACGLHSGSRRGAVVRSLAAAEPVAAWPWNRWLHGPGTDGLHCPSPRSAEAQAHLRGGRPVLGCLGAVAPERFRPADGAAFRAALGIPADAPVVGIAARVQPHRRFDLLLESLARLSGRHPAARLLVVGRGTHLDAVARRPAEALGLADRVVFAGYRTDDYAEAMAAIDVFTTVVPGSDGTCRAVLEAAAAGRPAVVSRRGALPEIVLDGETGVVADETPEAFARAFAALIEAPARRRLLGEAARARAHREFTPGRLAADLESLYDAVAGSPDSATRSR